MKSLDLVDEMNWEDSDKVDILTLEEAGLEETNETDNAFACGIFAYLNWFYDGDYGIAEQLITMSKAFYIEQTDYDDVMVSIDIDMDAGEVSPVKIPLEIQDIESDDIPF